jgi:rubredoxin
MASGFRKWQCRTCGEIYDEAAGLPYDGIPPGTRFEDLPDDWICPACGTPKADFTPCEA